jgi:hypothetical protein
LSCRLRRGIESSWPSGIGRNVLLEGDVIATTYQAKRPHAMESRGRIAGWA